MACVVFPCGAQYRYGTSAIIMLGTPARRGNTEGNGTMAQVFRGKIAIPENQMEAYFQALEQFEHDK
jgi:hypothetical protein